MKLGAVVETITHYILQGIPLIRSGGNLCTIIIDSVHSKKFQFSDSDFLEITQKIVSKSEALLVNLKQVRPSKRSIELASRIEKDRRLVDLILSDSKKMICFKKSLIVAQNHQVVILANVDNQAKLWASFQLGPPVSFTQ